MLKSTTVFPTISMSKHFRRIRNTYLIYADEHYSIFLKEKYLPSYSYTKKVTISPHMVTVSLFATNITIQLCRLVLIL